MVSTYTQPDFTSQLETAYKTNIDAGFDVFERYGDAFAPHAQSSPDMTIRLNAGHTFKGVTLTEVVAASTGTITAPSANPRIDRVTVDNSTGAITVTTGVEDASPTAPAIPSGELPIAQISLTVSQTTIVNSDITDERPFHSTSSVTAGSLLTKDAYATSSSTTQAHGLGAEPDYLEVILECTSDELNYSSGDRIDISAGLLPGGNSGLSLFKDATNVILIIGATDTISVIDKTGFGKSSITASKWKVLVTPYKFS